MPIYGKMEDYINVQNGIDLSLIISLHKHVVVLFHCPPPPPSTPSKTGGGGYPGVQIRPCSSPYKYLSSDQIKFGQK